jgi:soluble lytic murein transglycosylase-like protein
MDLTAIFLTVSTVYGLPNGLLSDLCYVESTHRPHVIVMDTNGYESIGLCQVQYRTAQWLGFKGKKEELLKPDVNAQWAAAYLAYQYKRYGNWVMAIKAYNAGSAKTQKPNSYFRKVSSVSGFSETNHQYVPKPTLLFERRFYE